MRIRTFLPNVMYSPDFEGGTADTSLDFENEGLDAPSGADYNDDDNAELEVNLDFEPDEDGNQNFEDDSTPTDHLPDEGDSDDGNSDEPDSTDADGDDEQSADDTQGDMNALYMRAGQLGVSAEDVAQYAEGGEGALNAYLSGLEAGGAGQQEEGEGKLNMAANADSFTIDPFAMDFGEEKGEFDENLMKNLEGMQDHFNKGLEQVMNVTTGLASEIIAMINGANENSETEKKEAEKTETTKATLNKRKLSASPKAQKKASKSEKGKSPKQKAADAIEDKYPGEFGE